MKLKLKFIIPLAVLLAGGIFFYDSFLVQKPKELPYSRFYELVQNKKVLSAKISEDEIYFKTEEKEFRTQNPGSPAPSFRK